MTGLLISVSIASFKGKRYLDAQPSIDLVTISNIEFSHGGTRQLAARLTQGRLIACRRPSARSPRSAL